MFPTNILPPSTYVKLLSGRLDTSTLNACTIWLELRRDCMVTPAMVCTAPESMVIHSPSPLRAADHPWSELSVLRACPVPGAWFPCTLE